MAKNGGPGNGRIGVIKDRYQVYNPKTNLWIKVNPETGRFMDDKTTGGPFKDIRKHQK